MIHAIANGRLETSSLSVVVAGTRWDAEKELGGMEEQQLGQLRVGGRRLVQEPCCLHKQGAQLSGDLLANRAWDPQGWCRGVGAGQRTELLQELSRIFRSRVRERASGRASA